MRFTLSRLGNTGQPQVVMMFVSSVIMGRKPEAA
jgi:hypothetical protein